MHQVETMLETALVWMLTGMIVSIFFLVKIGALKPDNRASDVLSTVSGYDESFMQEYLTDTGQKVNPE